VLPNQILCSHIKSPHVIQLWFKSNHDLDLPITATFLQQLSAVRPISPYVDMPQSLTLGQYDARPTVTFPAVHCCHCLIFHPAEGRRLSWSAWLVTYLEWSPISVTLLMWLTSLPLGQNWIIPCSWHGQMAFLNLIMPSSCWRKRHCSILFCSVTLTHNVADT